MKRIIAAEIRPSSPLLRPLGGSLRSGRCLPLPRKFQNAAADVEDIGVGHGAAGLDQPHGLVGSHALHDQDAGAHRHAAVTSVRAMGVDLAPVPDGRQRGPRAADEEMNRNREQEGVEGSQPQKVERRVMRVGLWTRAPAHVDDQPHAESAQAVVAAHGGRGADEQVIGDGGEIHAVNLTITRP